MSTVLRLVARYGERVRLFPWPAGEAIVGSSPGSDIVLPFPGVSRRHARLLPLGRELLLVDLGSKNGLVCAGRRLPQALLGRGGEVRLGRAALTLEEVPSSEADVALVLASPSSGDAEAQHTRTISAEPPASSARTALRLVREIERSGGEPASSQMAAACLVLGAQALLAFRAGGDGELAVIECWGALPSESTARALAAASTGDSWLRFCAEEGNRTALVTSSGGPDTVRLAAVFAGARHPSAWKRDLFDYLAQRRRAAGPIGTCAAPPATPLRLPEEMIPGESRAATRLLAELAVAARSQLGVLLIGETGTGKELLARALHESGPRAGGPFVAINCATLPAELAEAELFGVKARVATGVDPRPGLFERAHGGTLLLDEVGELPRALQPKLLRVLQEREVRALGAAGPRKVDVRIVAATNRDLQALAAAGRFRPDLYFRLRGVEIRVPPLRDRREDIPGLVSAFASRATALQGKRILGVSRGALAGLAERPWPGNVRELKDAVELAVLRCLDGGVLESRHFETSSPAGGEPPDVEPAGAGPAGPAPQRLQDRIGQLERAALLDALAASGGNKTWAARALGLTRNGLNLKLKRLGLA